MKDKIYDIEPVAKPRMTQRDKWAKRKCVVKYFEFKDKVRELGMDVKNGDSLFFVIPMPKSWSNKKKELMNMQPHMQRPDLDNYLKALLDSVFEEDSHIYRLSGIEKRWGYEGKIMVLNNEY